MEEAFCQVLSAGCFRWAEVFLNTPHSQAPVHMSGPGQLGKSSSPQDVRFQVRSGPCLCLCLSSCSRTFQAWFRNVATILESHCFCAFSLGQPVLQFSASNIPSVVAPASKSRNSPVVRVAMLSQRASSPLSPPASSYPRLRPYPNPPQGHQIPVAPLQFHAPHCSGVVFTDTY